MSHGKRPRETPEEVPGVTPRSGPGKLSSVGPVPRQQKLKREPQLTKKVPLHGDAARCVTIGAKLSDK